MSIKTPSLIACAVVALALAACGKTVKTEAPASAANQAPAAAAPAEPAAVGSVTTVAIADDPTPTPAAGVTGGSGTLKNTNWDHGKPINLVVVDGVVTVKPGDLVKRGGSARINSDGTFSISGLEFNLGRFGRFPGSLDGRVDGNTVKAKARTGGACGTNCDGDYSGPIS